MNRQLYINNTPVGFRTVYSVCVLQPSDGPAEREAFVRDWKKLSKQLLKCSIRAGRCMFALFVCRCGGVRHFQSLKGFKVSSLKVFSSGRIGFRLWRVYAGNSFLWVNASETSVSKAGFSPSADKRNKFAPLSHPVWYKIAHAAHRVSVVALRVHVIITNKNVYHSKD